MTPSRILSLAERTMSLATAPFKEDMQLDKPISPYAATKKACELLAYTYHHLFGLRCTGLRFFTVYGPAGRPDMAPFLFTRSIMHGRPITRAACLRQVRIEY